MTHHITNALLAEAPLNPNGSLRRAFMKVAGLVIEIEQVLYSAKIHTTGGRDGASRSSNGRLDVKLSPPGTVSAFANLEQFFAARWSACFEGATGLAGRKTELSLPDNLAIDAEIDLGMTGDAYLLRARLRVSVPSVDREVAQGIINPAHQTCPYAKATRDNIDLTIWLV